MLGADKDKSGPNMWVGAASLVERTMKTLFLGGITDDIDAKVTLSAGDRALLNGNLLTGFADMYGGGDINATKLFRYAETKLRSLGMPGIYPTMDPVLAAFASPEFPGMIADVIEQVQSCVAPPVSSYTCCGSTPAYNSVCSGYTQIGSSACRNVPFCRWSSTCSRRLATDGQVDAPSFDNDMQRYVKQMDGHAKRRLSSSPSPSNAPATPSPWSSSGTSGQSPSNAPATPSPWSSSGTSAQSPSNAPATRIDRSCCTAASNDGDYDCRCRDGSCWYAGDVRSGIVFPSSNWNKEGKTCKTKDATTTTTVAPTTTTTTTTVAPTTSDESNSEAAAINKTGSSSESLPGMCVNEEFSIPPGYLKVRKRGLCVRLHTGSGAFSFNGEL